MLTKMNILQKKLNNLKTTHLYIIFIILTIIVSTIYGYQVTLRFPNMVDNNLNLIVKNIPFAYGELINNLINTGEYSTSRWGFKMYLSRLPVLPFVISFLFQIYENIYFIIIVKNIFFFSIFFFLSHIFVKSNKLKLIFFFLLIGLFFYNPYNLVVLSSIRYADTLTAILVPCLFLSVLSDHKLKGIFFSIIVFALYLSKTNMFFLTITLSIIFFIIEKNHKLRSLPLISILFAIFIWGGFGYFKTGKFPFGQSLISINSWGMSYVLNKDFKDYYPYKSVDQINFEDKEKLFSNEWDFYNFYNDKNKIYLKENSNFYLKDIMIKAKFIFTDFYASGSETSSRDGLKKIRYSNIPNKIIFNFSLLIFLLSFLKSIYGQNLPKADIYFFFFCSSYLLPLLIGWATCKHLIGIFLVSKIYLLFKLAKKYNYTN